MLCMFDGYVSRYVSASGTPTLSAGYRLAPEHAHPVPVEDSLVPTGRIACGASRGG